MAITDLTMLQALKHKLKFHNERQRVLAENVANGSTPGYQGKDIKAPNFFRVAAEMRPERNVMPAATSPMHLQGKLISTAGVFKDEKAAGYEVTPDGNGVTLEEQMMKVTDNQVDYQMATSLYQRSIGLLRTAIGKA